MGKVRKHKRDGHKRIRNGKIEWVSESEISEHHRKDQRPKLNKQTKMDIIKGKAKKLKDKVKDVFNDELNYEDYLYSEDPISFEWLLYADEDPFILEEKDHSNISTPVNIFEYYGMDRGAYRGSEKEKKKIIDILVDEHGKKEAIEILEAHKI